MAQFWALIILKKIPTVNWSLSISKGNGEDPDPNNYTQGVIVRVANPIKVKIQRQLPRRSCHDMMVMGRPASMLNNQREREREIPYS